MSEEQIRKFRLLSRLALGTMPVIPVPKADTGTRTNPVRCKLCKELVHLNQREPHLRSKHPEVAKYIKRKFWKFYER